MRMDAARSIATVASAGIGCLAGLLFLCAGVTPARAESEIFVATSNGVQVFSRTASGNVAPARRIQAFGDGGVFVDSVNHEVYVTDFSAHAILVFARTANGNVAPVRTIKGAATQLNNPFGLFVDTVDNELIVAESGDDKVLVFSRTANGNVAPIRTIENHDDQSSAGFFGPLGVFVDLVNNELYVTATKLHTDVILVFPRTTNSTSATPIREIAVGFNNFPEGIFVNTATNEIIVACTLNDGEIRVYPRTATSPVPDSQTPLGASRTIKGALTGLNKPVGLDVDVANSEIVVANHTDGSVAVFPLSGSGNIAPTRLISGATTGLLSSSHVALGQIPTGLPASLLAAVLPASRSVKTGTAATAFATMINTSGTALTNCEIAQQSGPNAQLAYTFQTTDPATNQITGTANAPVSIPGGGVQTFVFAFTPAAAFAPIDVQLSFQCAGSQPAPVVVGLDTLLLSAAATPVLDVVALSATAGNNGIVDVAGVGAAALAAPAADGAGAFAVATVNVGASGQVTAVPDTGGVVLPVSLAICQTDPGTGACIGTPGASVAVQINSGETPTFAVFVSSQEAVAFDPAHNRIFVRFKDQAQVVRGATSVAVRTVP